MELIKHNQLLKIRVGYYQEIGRLCFISFTQHSGIEKIGEHKYAYFPTTPRWTAEELNAMTEKERQEWHDCLDLDWTRYTLADVSWKEWYEGAQEEECLPYRYTTYGHSQSDWAHLYLFGMSIEEAEPLLLDFQLYAYETPYWYRVELIDCETGETVADESLSGVYDTDTNLEYLKTSICESLRGMKCLRPELLDLALERVQAMQHTDIVC